MKIKNSKLKIIFLGTPDFVEPVINTINKNFDLFKIIRNPQQLNKEVIEQLKKLPPDLIVVAAFGKILTTEVLEIPKLGIINIHPSLLPNLRGSTPIQTAILNGDEITGVTIIKMDEKMDHGPILAQTKEQILPTDTFESLSKRLFEKSTDTLVQVITNFSDIKPTIQNEKKATYTKILSKEDGFIDLDKIQNSNFKFQIERAVRAFHPWPGVWTKAQINNQKTSIIKLLPNRRIQVEGKNPMNYKDFMNGYPQGKDFLQKLSLI